MQGNTVEAWNMAARQVYGFDTVDVMEEAWLAALRTPPSRTSAARGSSAPATPTGGRGTETALTAAPRTDVRSSAAPAIPVLEPPVKAARGTAPEADAARGTAAGFPPGANPCPTGTCPNVRPIAPDRPPPVLLPPEIPRPARQ
jgi:hypothetical protein